MVVVVAGPIDIRALLIEKSETRVHLVYASHQCPRGEKDRPEKNHNVSFSRVHRVGNTRVPVETIAPICNIPSVEWTPREAVFEFL